MERATRPPSDVGQAGSAGPVERLLADYARSRDPALREKLVVLHLDLVSRLARQLAGRSAILDDLIQVGYIGLIKAIDRFEPERNVAFVAYAVPTIAGEMKRYLRDMEPMIHIPRQIQERRLNVQRTVDQLTQRLHRPPTDEEIAAELGIDPRHVTDVNASELARPVSLDQRVGIDSDQAAMVLADVIAEDDDPLGRSEDRLLLERVIGRLTPRQRKVLISKFYKGLSQAAIGEQLSLSQMQVSRLWRAALACLQEGMAEIGADALPAGSLIAALEHLLEEMEDQDA
jgi:RNA polymerase sigma-B factor